MAVGLSASIKHSRETNEQYTPKYILDPVREVLGKIDLDPATSHLANERVQAKAIYTIDDGLATFEESWEGNVFLNPPGGKKMVLKGTGKSSNPALFWSKLMYEWNAGNVNAAIVLGFTIEVLQTTQAEEEYPMLRFPFCIPARRIQFDLPREEKIRQLVARQEKAKTEKQRQRLGDEIEELRGLEAPIVSGDDPPHANVLVLVPPRAEHNWGGPYTRRFYGAFSQLGYVRL